MVKVGDKVNVRVDENGKTRWIPGTVRSVIETGRYVLDELQVYIRVETNEGMKTTSSLYGVYPIR